MGVYAAFEVSVENETRVLTAALAHRRAHGLPTLACATWLLSSSSTAHSVASEYTAGRPKPLSPRWFTTDPTAALRCSAETASSNDSEWIFYASESRQKGPAAYHRRGATVDPATLLARL